MPLPSTKTDVPRASVGGEVSLMLLNQQVTEIDVRQQVDGKFTVAPRGTPAPPAPPATRRKKSTRRKKPRRGSG